MSPRTVYRGTAEHRAWQALGFGGLAVVVLLIAIVVPDYDLLQTSAVMAWAVALLGLNLIIGYGGQMALGQSAFYGLGAYLTAILYTGYGWSFLATIPISALVGAVLGLILGLPALRISGLYLALVTLALALAFPNIVSAHQLASLTGGANGKVAFISWKPPAWLPPAVSDTGWMFLTLSVIAAVLFWLASNVVRSRVGRAIVALRDNETGAVLCGVPAARWKTATFAVGSAYAAVGGSMMILAASVVGPNTGGFNVAVTLVTGMVIGGVASLPGSMVGAIAIVYLPQLSKGWAAHLPLLTSNQSGVLSDAIYGLLLITVVFVMPGGVAAFVRRLSSRVIRFQPRLPVLGPDVMASGRTSVAETGQVCHG